MEACSKPPSKSEVSELPFSEISTRGCPHSVARVWTAADLPEAMGPTSKAGSDCCTQCAKASNNGSWLLSRCRSGLADEPAGWYTGIGQQIQGNSNIEMLILEAKVSHDISTGCAKLATKAEHVHRLMGLAIAAACHDMCWDETFAEANKFQAEMIMFSC